MRRGLFLQDVVYSISYAGVIAKDVKALAQEGSSLALPVPSSPNYGGGEGSSAAPCSTF